MLLNEDTDLMIVDSLGNVFSEIEKWMWGYNMAVYVTGDLHGVPTRLSKDSFYEQKDFSGNKAENIVIILGDSAKLSWEEK